MPDIKGAESMASGNSTCRVCKSDQMFMCLPLGNQPPANQFLKKEQLKEFEPSFPLDTHVCLNCALIQVPNFIPPDFFRQYVYMPSVSATLQRHFGQFAELLTAQFHTDRKSVV